MAKRFVRNTWCGMAVPQRGGEHLCDLLLLAAFGGLEALGLHTLYCQRWRALQALFTRVRSAVFEYIYVETQNPFKFRELCRIAQTNRGVYSGW